MRTTGARRRLAPSHPDIVRSVGNRSVSDRLIRLVKQARLEEVSVTFGAAGRSPVCAIRRRGGAARIARVKGWRVMAHLVRGLSVVALIVSSIWAQQALAADSLATINAPADGANLAPGQASKVEYEVKQGTKAHHVHLFVDGAEVATGHKLKGSFELAPLKAGEHKLCVAPVNHNHTPIGEKACIGVTAQ